MIACRLVGSVIGALVILVAMVSTASAAEPVKSGVSPQGAAKLKQVVDTSLAKESAERAKALQQASQACIDQLMAERDAFNAVLSKQPEYGDMKREYDAIMAAVKDPKATTTQKQQEDLHNRMRSFAQKYESVQSRAYAQAKINDSRVQAVLVTNLERVLGKVRAKKVGTGWLLTPLVTSPVQPPQPSCFAPPYDAEGTYASWEQFNSLTPNGWVGANRTTGELEANVQTAILDYQYATATVSKYATVAEGEHRFRFTANFEARYDLMAFAGPGVSWVTADLAVSPLDDNIIISIQRLPLGYVIAPVAWLAVVKGNDKFTVVLEDDLSGPEIGVLARTSAVAQGGGVSQAWAGVKAVVTSVCIEAMD